MEMRQTLTTANAGHAAQRASSWSTRLSLRACLGLALMAMLVVLAAGMRLVQQTTSQTAMLVGNVESRYEPALRKSRDLAETVAAFDRLVIRLSPAATPEDHAAVRTSGANLVAVLDEYMRLAPPAAGVEPSDLRRPLENLRDHGLVLSDLYRLRGVTIQRSLVALNSLEARTARAGRGVESDGQVLARVSLAELARAAATMRASLMALFAGASAAHARAAASDAGAFATLIRSHEDELALSPGRAWLYLEREDFAIAARGQKNFIEIDQKIAAERAALDSTAHELTAEIENHLQKPAWRALTLEAGRARITVEQSKTDLARVALTVLAVLLVIAGVIIHGIMAPARRLLEVTRRLAYGAHDARVPRGGVRDLDELAVAFNEMADALSSTKTELLQQHSALENRVAERTAELRHLANHDPLTGLPNRRELEAHLAAAIDRTRLSKSLCAVLYMDIDNFKTINDSLGHQFGDNVLHEIGTRLLEVAGAGVFVARLGGDEFTLVIEQLESSSMAEACVRRILSAFHKPVRAADRDVLVSLSIGIAMCPDHGQTPAALLQAADSALFHAKDRGRNGFSLYRPELLTAAAFRFHTEQGLRRAISTGDLLLHFQPEVSLVDQQTSVVEALLRWRQPDGRIASAGEFIEIAEESGLILDLTDWLLCGAIDAARRLRNGAWPKARVAINVAAQQFLTGQFVESVERALRDAQMPADCLEIELTETALQTGRVVVGALHELRRLGVAVALDDFGAGYSSVKSIGDLPLTRVKLDRSLMKDIDSNATTAAIAHSIIRLCQGLGLTVTAEGIERPEQLEFLADCGDIHVQGFLIAAPAPLEEIARFIAETPAPEPLVRQKHFTLVGATTPPRDNSLVEFRRSHLR